jgi:hypothetical protein
MYSPFLALLDSVSPPTRDVRGDAIDPLDGALTLPRFDISGEAREPERVSDVMGQA